MIDDPQIMPQNSSSFLTVCSSLTAGTFLFIFLSFGEITPADLERMKKTAENSHFSSTTDSVPCVSSFSFAAVLQPRAADQSDQDIAMEESFIRISNLKELACEEEIAVSPGSERDLRFFLADVDCSRRPYIALLDNGNFRAVWKGAGGAQIGLQFRGGGVVHHVLLAPEPSGRRVAQAVGRGTAEQARRLVEDLGLGRLMTA